MGVLIGIVRKFCETKSHRILGFNKITSPSAGGCFRTKMSVIFWLSRSGPQSEASPKPSIACAIEALLEYSFTPEIMCRKEEEEKSQHARRQGRGECLHFSLLQYCLYLNTSPLMPSMFVWISDHLVNGTHTPYGRSMPVGGLLCTGLYLRRLLI